MNETQNKFFPPPPRDGRDYLDLPYGDPEASEGRESEEISIRKRGAVKSDWSRGKSYGRRKRLIDYDPSLDYEMIGPAISQFTGFNDGKRWSAMRIPSSVPDGFLSNSTPGPFVGPSGSGHTIGNGTVRRTIQREQRHQAEVSALVGQNTLELHRRSMMAKYNNEHLLGAAQRVIRDGTPTPPEVKDAILQARNSGGRRMKKPDLVDLILRNESLHDAVMADLERSGVRRKPAGRPRRAPQQQQEDYFDTGSRLTTAGRPLNFSTDPINQPVSTDDPTTREQMAESEAQRNVRDSEANPELMPHGRDLRPPAEEKSSGRMPAHMQYEGGGRGGEGYRDAGNRRR